MAIQNDNIGREVITWEIIEGFIKGTVVTILESIGGFVQPDDILESARTIPQKNALASVKDEFSSTLA